MRERAMPCVRLLFLIAVMTFGSARAECLLEDLSSQVNWPSAVSNLIHKFDKSHARTAAFIFEDIEYRDGGNSSYKKLLSKLKAQCGKNGLQDFKDALVERIANFGVAVAALDSSDLQLVLSEAQNLGLGNMNPATYSRLSFLSINYVVRVRPRVEITLDEFAAQPKLSLDTTILEAPTRQQRTHGESRTWQHVPDAKEIRVTSAFVQWMSDGKLDLRLVLRNDNDGPICLEPSKVFLVSAYRMGQTFESAYPVFKASGAIWHRFLSSDLCVSAKDQTEFRGTVDPPFGKALAKCMVLDTGLASFIEDTDWSVDADDPDVRHYMGCAVPKPY